MTVPKLLQPGRHTTLFALIIDAMSLPASDIQREGTYFSI